jgi:hypothetical protein
LAQTMPLIESANAPANSDDTFIRLMCFLPGSFSADRCADLHCLKFPWSVTIVPSAVKANTTCRHACRHNVTGALGGRP